MLLKIRFKRGEGKESVIRIIYMKEHKDEKIRNGILK